MVEVRLREVARPSDHITQANEPVRALRSRFELEAMRSMIVIDDGGPVGVITRNTVRGLSDEQLDDPVRAHTLGVPILRDTMTITEAREAIRGTDFGAEQLPVVNDQGRLIGSVSRDQLREQAPSHVSGEASHTLAGGSGRQVTITTGMDVRSVDGKKLGSVDDLLVEGNSVRSMSVKYGFLGRHHKPVPGDVVKDVTEDGVVLAIGEMEFKALADAEVGARR